MIQLTLADFATMIRGFNSPVIASFSARTVPTMLAKHRETKLPNPYKNRVIKISRVNGVVGNFDFSNVVTNQRIREAKPETVEEIETIEQYISAPRQWGEHEKGTGLVSYNGKFYLRISHARSLEYRYYIDGFLATIDQTNTINSYLPQAKKVERHETEKQIIYRDYTLSNITEFRAAGKIYQILPEQDNVA